MRFRSFIFLAILLIVAAFRPVLPASGKNPVQNAIVKVTSITKDSTESTKPWIYWYWMHGAVTKEAITADLEAMKEAGLAGAYIFSIRDVPNPPLYEPSVRTMTPEWWQMVKHAMSEADRLGIKIGMNSCDGFTAAGGPWITPEMSMQKVVWADTIVPGNQILKTMLPQPESYKGYYHDIAVFAYPAPDGAGVSSWQITPKVTTSVKDADVSYLSQKGNKKIFNSSKPCWIQYSFEQPFTCRSLTIVTGWNNYQSNRLKIEISDDGANFKQVCRLEAPRSGWLDLDANNTHLIQPVTSRFFRFVYDPEGSEPGAEDLDDAKWSPALKISGIELSAEAKNSQFEGKSGAIWRISQRTDNSQFPESAVIKRENLMDITTSLKADGLLEWKVPAGKWVILRMGHTSTGHTNYVGGGGMGLECDKFDPKVVSFQFDQWFGEIIRQVGPELSGKVLKRFHVDSWECGSQNWSPVFRESFRQHRGYDLLPYLPVMSGKIVENAVVTERVLSDVRQTISDLVTEGFYKVSADLAHNNGCLFSAESVAPVVVSDGMLHFRETDIPMGEFWLNSPSHDKPNDVLDAVSAGHIYGKNIIQAEGFTEIRLDWNEHPGMMKTLADRNFALGINRMVFHVMTLNPWKDRKPGMTLDKVGTFFQRDQTWWKPGKAWFSYINNCQKFLQAGKPVTDIAIFTGEETPRRALLPDRLVDILPGIIGPERVKKEKERLENKSLAVRDVPSGVKTRANMANPEDWTDPLRGYAYDSFNRDALLRLATVENGRITLPGGANYALLVIPGRQKMSPDGGRLMSIEVARKLLQLANDGATLILMEKPVTTPGFQTDPNEIQQFNQVIDELFSGERSVIKDAAGGQFLTWKKGKGRIIQGPYQAATFNKLGIAKDFQAMDETGNQADHVAWNHRKDEQKEIYFIANQQDKPRMIQLAFRTTGKIPRLYHPVTGEFRLCAEYRTDIGTTRLAYRFEPNESLFVIFDQQDPANHANQVVGAGAPKNWVETTPIQNITSDWKVQFDPAFGGPAQPINFKALTDWSQNSDERIRHYSGTATYQNSFKWETSKSSGEILWLEIGSVANIAEVIINGKSCGICWTPPFRVRIDHALQQGENRLEIAVTNTWANRIKGDHETKTGKPVTATTAPYRLEGKPLLPAGLFGPVSVSKTR
jgi:hypothetical protein